MERQQLLYAKVVFEAQFAELHTNSFQEYFQKLMQYRYSTFLPVRTHGNLGDMASDGLCTDADKLYACYGPESPTDAGVGEKFRKDLTHALVVRRGQFSRFVFVHNDRRGMHPRIAGELMAAKHEHPEITFEQMGRVALWREFMRLSLDEAEDMLGQAIQVVELVYGISLIDLEPLLAHLTRTRDQFGWSAPHVIPQQKIEFNQLSRDAQEFLVHGMRFVKQVADYYDGHYDVLARDEAAAAFREKYESLRGQGLMPDEIFLELFVYVVGNRLPGPTLMTSAYTILSYFFQTCDIFEEPPSDFAPSGG